MLKRISVLICSSIIAILLFQAYVWFGILRSRLDSGGGHIAYASASWNLLNSFRLNIIKDKAIHAPPLKWERSYEGKVLAVSLRNDDGEIYISSGNTLAAWDISGKTIWVRHFVSRPKNLVVTENGAGLYLVDATGQLTALDKSGRTMWRKTFPDWNGIFSVSATGGGGKLLVVSEPAANCAQKAALLASDGHVIRTLLDIPGKRAFFNAGFAGNGNYIFSQPWRAMLSRLNACNSFHENGAYFGGNFTFYDMGGRAFWSAARRDWSSFWMWRSSGLTEALPGVEWNSYFTGGITDDGKYAFAQDRIYDIDAKRIIWQTPTPLIESTVRYHDRNGFIMQSWGADIGALAKLTRLNRGGEIQWTIPIYGHSVLCDDDVCYVSRMFFWRGCDLYSAKNGKRIGYLHNNFRPIHSANGYLLGIADNKQVLRVYSYASSGELLWTEAMPIGYRTVHGGDLDFVAPVVPDYDVYTSENLSYVLLRRNSTLYCYKNGEMTH